MHRKTAVIQFSRVTVGGPVFPPSKSSRHPSAWPAPPSRGPQPIRSLHPGGMQTPESSSHRIQPEPLRETFYSPSRPRGRPSCLCPHHKGAGPFSLTVSGKGAGFLAVATPPPRVFARQPLLASRRRWGGDGCRCVGGEAVCRPLREDARVPQRRLRPSPPSLPSFFPSFPSLRARAHAGALARTRAVPPEGGAGVEYPHAHTMHARTRTHARTHARKRA